MSTGVIIPVKDLKDSKSRLSNDLERFNRIVLSTQMLLHTLDVANSSENVSEIVVVSSDDNVKDITQQKNVTFIKESGNFSVNNAVSIAIDLICLTISDVKNIIALGKQYDIVLVPSKDGNGTNALYLKLPNLFHTRFDNSSLNNHILESFKRNLKMKIYVSYPTIMDVDSYDDLSFVVRYSNETSINDYLYNKSH